MIEGSISLLPSLSRKKAHLPPTISPQKEGSISLLPSLPRKKGQSPSYHLSQERRVSLPPTISPKKEGSVSLLPSLPRKKGQSPSYHLSTERRLSLPPTISHPCHLSPERMIRLRTICHLQKEKKALSPSYHPYIAGKEGSMSKINIKFSFSPPPPPHLKMSLK